MVKANHYKISSFPDGTPLIKKDLTINYLNVISIVWTFESMAELPTVIMIAKDAKDNGADVELFMPYIPNARMDRAYHDEDTRGWLFVDEIEHDLLPEMKDPQAKIYEKRTFGSTLLMEDLCDSHFSTIGGMADFKINSITLVGLCTDICVISNALLLKAALPEVPIIVDASCCAGVTPESHKNALAAMKMCQIEIVNEE